jgi:DNA polymerase III sliding clamp (beta) subunit (PCNA family)
LVSGVTIYSMLLDDRHPQELFNLFGQPDGSSFVLNRKTLITCLDTIQAVMGNNETSVSWTRDKNSWKLSCKTYKGAEVVESVVPMGDLDNVEDFGVHRKAMIDALKAMDTDEITIFTGSRSFVYLVSSNKMVALTKFSG